jgi:hypothetical protein
VERGQVDGGCLVVFFALRHGTDDDSGCGPSSYFAHAMSKND